MFSKWASLALLAYLVPAALAAPAVRQTDYECKKPAIRKEWRTLSDQKKHQFHRATKCLRTKPSKIDTYGQSQNVWDDFAWVHYTTNRTIHKVANFLPWHRYFLILREQELAECGYKDPIPYWNWVDESTVESFTSSSIFDAEKGFGGTGVLEEGAEVNSTQWCVPDGPYADVELTYPAPHCLNRRQNITETIASNWTSKVVKEISEYPDYINFWNYTERFPHDNVHRAIGGDIRLQSSPNDPLFFLHHAQIDRLWTLWQGRNKTRLEDYGGNTVQNTTVNVAELSDELNMLGFAPTKSVEDYMDTMANGLCYDYE